MAGPVKVLAATIAATLLLGVGAAVGAVPRFTTADVADQPGAAVETAAAPIGEPATTTVVVPVPAPPAPEVAAEPEPAAEPQPPTTTTTPPTTVAPPPPTVPSTTAAPTTAPAPAPVRLPPGQRVEPTDAQVQTAIAQLHQRIPLFSPTDSQLRTFAEAVCVSFDQGQTQSQVESTVSQAVSRIQGASLSAPDAAFAVALVVRLRCPGYLP